MSKNRRVKQTSRAKPKAQARAQAKPQGGGRSREIVGIVSLGAAIFVSAALFSLQTGDGHFMGPFGRSIARAVYALGGMCSYLVAVALGLIAIRLLTGRATSMKSDEGAGIGIGILSLATLAHLAGSSYRVSGHAPGGILGEHIAEVLRAVISTPGTALVAVMGLVVAVVVATPLRMRQVLDAIAWSGQTCGRGIVHAAHVSWQAIACAARALGRAIARGARATVHFCGEVVRALLPERDHDEYYERDVQFAEEEEEYDAYQVEPGADPAFVEPPIIIAESRSEGMSAAPIAEIEDATEKVDDEELAARMAALDDATPAAEDAATPAGKKSGKKKRRTKKKTVPGLGDERAPGKAEAEEEPAPVAAEASEAAEAEPAVAEVAEKAGPVIVESKFKNPDAAEMRRREKETEAERRGFVKLGEGEFELPPINLLDYDESSVVDVDKTAMLEQSARLSQTLEHFGVKGEVIAIRPGPVVTMYEFAPAPGTRVSKIANLGDDLAMALEAVKVRIVAPIPGKAAVGIEVPNKTKEMVYLKEILAHETFRKSKAKLPLALGKDIEGGPCVVDLSKMPHLLVAGTTGSGKSVAVNSMVCSLLYNSSPEDVRMIMVDPKMLELSIYDGIPHLLLPVVTDPKRAALALRWAEEEMDRRYDLLATLRVRDITSYNKKRGKLQAAYDAEKFQRYAEEAARLAGEDEEVEVTEDRQLEFPCATPEPPERLPHIVVVIDEFADLMMCAAKEVERSVARIAQLARAAGIHMILATQRPSVDVITGLIKSNFPSRIAFRVAQKVDSRTILDQQGAESLLGAGDMLFLDRGNGPGRIHGCYVDTAEINRVVEFLKEQGRPVYNLDILKPREEEGGGPPEDEERDAMYDNALQIVQETRQASISMIQRRLRVGYNRAARMVEHMERDGVVSPPDGTNRREVLLPPAAQAL